MTRSRLLAAVMVACLVAVAGCDRGPLILTPGGAGATEAPRHGQGGTTSPAPSGVAVADPSAGALKGPWSVPFGSRKASGPINLEDCRDIVIEGWSFRDLGPNVEAIRLDTCENVTIRGNDFINVAQGITVYNSKNVRIEWNRYENILGPHARVGLNRADFVQFVNVAGGYIGNNKGRGGDTEDIVSIVSSHGTAKSPITIEDNHFEGTDWISDSGSGIMLGDGGGTWQIARNNTLLNAGQAGIGIAGGADNAVIGNTIYGEPRLHSNVGIAVFGHPKPPNPCATHTVGENRVSFRKADGAEAGAWSDGLCPTFEWPRGPADVALTGGNTNDFNADLNPEELRVKL